MKNIRKRKTNFLIIFFMMFMITISSLYNITSYAGPGTNTATTDGGGGKNPNNNSNVSADKNNGSGSGSDSSGSESGNSDPNSLEANMTTETEEVKLPVDAKSVDEAKKSLQDILTGSNGLVKIVQSMGYLIILFGLFKFALSLKDENAEGKSQAIMILMGGVFAVVLPSIIDAIFQGTAISGLLTK